MKNKKIIQTLQIAFLIIVPKKLLFAKTQVPEWIYTNNRFVIAESCTSTTTGEYPFYVVNRTLINNESQLDKGSLIVLEKGSTAILYDKPFRMLKSPKQQIQQMTTANIPLNFLEQPNNWTFLIHTSKTTPLGKLNGKILQLNETNHRIHNKTCCFDNICNTFPVFNIIEKNKIIAKIAFAPSSFDFIQSYSAIKAATKSEITSLAPTATINTNTEKTLNTSRSTDLPPTPMNPQDKVICTQKGRLNIYNDSLKKVIYSAPRFLPVKIFQSWNDKTENKKIKGHQAIKIQLQNNSGKEINGWAVESYIKSAADCTDLPLVYAQNPDEDVIPDTTAVVDTPTDCCRFPTLHPPSLDYTHGSGKRYFGANRSKRRAHAAADLMRPKGERVLAIDNGRILRKYHFYAGTYAIEVKHDNGYLVRYGEVQRKNVPQSKDGQRVSKGQHIGYIDHLKMLHFELYSDKVSGPLTQRGKNKYSRRSDLMDPTPFLVKWEELSF